ncbi:hypothetical protein [Fulvivirga ligni]|uniref:hypothetical protein n=1 Tax=Fulvivirga ligni TaxID=2904246 RepID=UPI001F3B3C03|nr:hypothetical protein [Fulvivirga ligni]UII21746.1 hypothetical protein LVD16_00655 [Fulvivirga ligni]
MNKGTKVIIGLLTIFPLVLGFIYAASIFGIIFTKMNHGPHFEPDDEVFIRSFLPFFFILIGSGFVSLVMLVYYLVHAAKNERFESTQRLIWILIIVFGNSIGQLVYFFMEIWPDNPKSKF